MGFPQRNTLGHTKSFPTGAQQRIPLPKCCCSPQSPKTCLCQCFNSPNTKSFLQLLMRSLFQPFHPVFQSQTVLVPALCMLQVRAVRATSSPSPSSTCWNGDAPFGLRLWSIWDAPSLDLCRQSHPRCLQIPAAHGVEHLQPPCTGITGGFKCS